MAGRSPARFLAPLALVAVALALFLVVTAAPDEERPAATRQRGPRHRAGASATPSGQQPAKRKKVRQPVQGEARRHAVGHRREDGRPARRDPRR